MRRLIAAATLTLLAACSNNPGPAADAFDVMIENVNVVDATSGLRENQRVLIAGDRIVRVEPVTSPAPAAASVVDGTGLYATPGLWDMHVHFIYDLELTEAMPDLFLDYGITSVRDTGGDMAQLAALRARLEEGETPIPDIFISGPLLDGELVVYDGGDPGRPPLGTQVASLSQTAQRVAELDRMGADFIKIYELVSPAVFLDLVAEARARNLPIAAHVPLSMTADTAGPRVDSMEHLRNVELACARDWEARLQARRQRLDEFVGRGYDLRAELHSTHRVPSILAYDETRCADVLQTLTGTIQVPTLRLNTMSVARPFERTAWQKGVMKLPRSVRDRWLAATSSMPPATDTTFADWSLTLTGLMNDAGVPVGAGTDTPIGFGIPGESLHNELAMLVDSGLSATEAFRAATVIPARFFGLDDQMGQVAPGFEADLLLLGANPLENISATRQIRRVMSDGAWVR